MKSKFYCLLLFITFYGHGGFDDIIMIEIYACSLPFHWCTANSFASATMQRMLQKIKKYMMVDYSKRWSEYVKNNGT